MLKLVSHNDSQRIRPTAKPHLAAGCQYGLKHLTNLDISEKESYTAAADAIVDHCHDLEEDDLVPRGVASFEFTMRNSAT